MWESNPRISKIPSDDVRATLAGVVGSRLLGVSQGAEAQDFASALGWQLEVRSMGRRTVEALLAPLFRGGFQVVVNGDLDPDADRTTWLLCHEIGHSLFWRPGIPPRRIVPTLHGEEEHADAFADELVRVLRGCREEAA